MEGPTPLLRESVRPLLAVVAALVLCSGLAVGAHIAVTVLGTESVAAGNGAVNGATTTVDEYALQYDRSTNRVNGIRVTIQNHGANDVTVDVHAAVKNQSTTRASTRVTETVRGGKTTRVTLTFGSAVAPSNFNTVEVGVTEV